MAAIDPVILQLRADSQAYVRDIQQATVVVDRELGRQQGAARSLSRNVNQEFSRAGASAGQLGQEVGTLSTQFQRLGSTGTLALLALKGAIAGIGIGTVAQLGREVLQFADDLATAADQANISVERYQTLREGLRVLELSTAQTDKVLKTLNSTLGEVQGGTAAKGVTEALQRMGVEAKILSGEITTTDGLLDAIAASSKNYATEAQFTADVVALFGKRVGVDLAAALKDGGVALKEQEQTFRDAGNVISQEYVAKLADANEVIDRFKSQSTAKLTIWAAETIDYVQRVATALEDIPWYRLGPASLGQAALKARSDRAFDRDFGFGGIPDRERRDRAAIEALPAGSDVRRELERRYQDTYLRPFNAPAAAPTPVVRPPASGGGGSSSPARSGAAAAQPLTPAQARLAGVQQTNALAPALDGFSRSAAAVELIKVNLGEVQAIAEKISESRIISAEAIDAAERLGDGLATTLANALASGEALGPALARSLQQAGAELLRSGLLQLFNGSPGSGGGLFGSIIGSIFGRASGGYVAPGQTVRVNEQRGGAEFLSMGSQGGTVIPLGQINQSAYRGGAGGGVATVRLELSGDIDARIQSVSAGVAVEVVRGAAPTIIDASAREARARLTRPRI